MRLGRPIGLKHTNGNNRFHVSLPSPIRTITQILSHDCRYIAQIDTDT